MANVRLALAYAFGILSGAYGQSGLLPKKYNTLPLGNVRPLGWLADQLDVQMNGLGGHEHEFFDYVSKTDWVGGPSRYSTLEEAGSYWFNAAVPASVLANHDVIFNKAQEFLDYVIEHQEEGGWLGPEAGKTDQSQFPRYLWGRYPFMFGAIQMVEYDPSQTDKVVNALHKFVQVANTMLHNGQGMEIWTQTRWADFVMSLEWLYDNHPNGKEELLIDTMKQVKYAGVPWEEVFKTKNFPTIAVDTLQNPTGYVLSWHGVNLAEGIKALPAAWRFTHNESDLTRTSEGWDLLYKYHGRPSGAFSADEYLAGLEATRGSELCSVVEMMFSNSYLFQIMGDLKYLDKAEKTAYNALPATITADHWAHQYNQQQNQIASRNMTPNPFYVDGPYANVFGLEPYYPCCTVNHPQGWPKFITHSFLTTNDRSSLIQVYHGPLQVETTLSGNNKVSVNVDTLYPFSDVVTTTINASSSYTHFVRIPSWVAGGTFSINGATQQPLKPTNGLQSFSIPSGKTTIILNLTPQITTEARLHGSIAIHRGPLHYAFDISYNSHILKADPDEPRAADYQFDATSDWQFAIDPSTFKFINSPPADGKLPSPIYDSNLPPVAIEVSACPIQWKEAGQTFAAPPPQNPRCVGDVRTIKLTPYGSTKLRISEFPVFSA